MQKECPRCESLFECKEEDIKSCACSEVILDPATNEFLKKTHYKDCLCNTCLKELNVSVLKVKGQPFNPKLSSLKEGEYWYKENGLTVLSELYHISKGSCCMSGCKHCAYGFHSLFK